MGSFLVVWWVQKQWGVDEHVWMVEGDQEQRPIFLTPDGSMAACVLIDLKARSALIDSRRVVRELLKKQDQASRIHRS